MDKLIETININQIPFEDIERKMGVPPSAFLNAPDSAGVYEFDEARRSADILLMKADFNKENTELTVTLATPDYMSTETAEKLKPFLRRPIVYHWKNGVFTK